MTVKARGIKLKSSLPLEDQGQQKLLEVTYSQLAFVSQARGADTTPMETESPSRLSDTRRRSIARMLRVELESTLDMLDRAITKARSDEP